MTNIFLENNIAQMILSQMNAADAKGFARDLIWTPDSFKLNGQKIELA